SWSVHRSSDTTRVGGGAGSSASAQHACPNAAIPAPTARRRIEALRTIARLLAWHCFLAQLPPIPFRPPERATAARAAMSALANPARLDSRHRTDYPRMRTALPPVVPGRRLATGGDRAPKNRIAAQGVR